MTPGPPPAPTTYLVESLTLTEPWRVGPALLEPPGVAHARSRRAWSRTSKGRIAFDQMQTLMDPWLRFPTITVAASDYNEAGRRAIDVLRVLRLYQRISNPNADLHVQTFGLHGELNAFRRDALTFGPAASIRFNREGNLASFEFPPEQRRAVSRDPRITFLLNALAVDRSHRRAIASHLLLALELIDLGWRSHDSRLFTLNLAIAMEVMLSRSERGGEVLRIARRTAYLTCYGRCGRGTPACGYLYPFSHRPQVQAFIRERMEQGLPAACSAFLQVPDELFNDRNLIVHQGRSDISPDRAAHHHRWVEDALLHLIDWAVAHPSGSLRALDEEIDQMLDITSPHWSRPAMRVCCRDEPDGPQEASLLRTRAHRSHDHATRDRD